MAILTRIQAFDAYVKTLGIPFSGIGGEPATNPAGPGTVVINYLPAATPEQIATGDAAVQAFDWRPRRYLTPAQRAANIATLSVAQELALRRRMWARILELFEPDFLQILSDLGITLAYDEVAP